VVEVNSARATLLSFSTTDIFLNDLKVSENDVLERRSPAVVLTWVIQSSDWGLNSKKSAVRYQPIDNTAWFRRRLHSFVWRYT